MVTSTCWLIEHQSVTLNLPVRALNIPNGGSDEDEWDEHELMSKISSKKIEDLKSLFKAHRCALDFDAGFINFVCKEKEQPVSEQNNQ